MKQSEFLKEMDRVFELPPGTITVEDRLQELPGWGSLTFLGLIGMVDEEVGVALTPKTLLNCKTVSDLLKFLGPHLTQD